MNLLLQNYTMHPAGDYDLAGFAVGVVERHMMLPRTDITPGDILLGLSSSGLHSNGFSLVRKIISVLGLSYSSPCPWQSETTLGRVLLEPTRIYVKQILPSAHAGLIKAMAHITGGGFLENVPRILPHGLGCFIDVSAWDLPPVFQFLMKHGGVEPVEMARTFNNGIGMVIIVGRLHLDQALHMLREGGSANVFQIGKTTAGCGVEMRNLSSWK